MNLLGKPGPSLSPKRPSSMGCISTRFATICRLSPISNLIVNIPPGHAKSLLTAVFWPAWVWINHPEARWLFSS